jgi:hypothetical protein
MARMNEGLSRRVSELADIPELALVPVDPDPSRTQTYNEAQAHWAPCGPGWFDSSWLLHRGLEVTELCPVVLLDSVLRELQTQSPPDENVPRVPA